MKIADKIKLLVIPLILIPFLIIIGGTLVFGRIYMKRIIGLGSDGSLESYTNSIVTVNGLVEEVFSQLQEDAEQDPEQFLDMEYLDGQNEKLSVSHALFLVRIEGEIYYRGGKDTAELEPLLPGYVGDTQTVEGRFVDASNHFFLKQLDFTLEDGRQCSAFIAINTRTMTRNMRRILLEIMIMIIVVLILVSGFTSLYIFWIFVRPLKLLQEGTERIKEGNLEEDVEVLSYDEIGQVCQSFNEMRLKLKESVDDQMRYEQENRELISNISHDLKTPITAIKGYVEGIMDGVADTPEKMDRYIRTIYNKANEMDVLINELSLYTQIDNNSIPYNFVKLNIASYFDDCIEDISTDMEAAGAKLQYENHCDRSMRVIADPEQLRRVISNILINAVKYNSKENRSIQIVVEPYENDKEYVYIGIRDNGNGIAQKDLHLIFKRMYRGDSSRNTATGGSGLGLSIAKRIVEEHGGKIWAESEEGTGTLIAFTLKVYRES